MASIRKLKKTIDSKIFELLSDCFTCSELHPDNKPDELSGIVSDAVNFRNELIHRVNNPGTEKDPKGIRVHYQLINRELDAGIDKLFERLSSLSKKKKK